MDPQPTTWITTIDPNERNLAFSLSSLEIKDNFGSMDAVRATLNFGQTFGKLPGVDFHFELRLNGFTRTWLVVKHHDNYM